ncbi:MAG: hypothetical protein WAU65_02260 [Candidatus Nanoarchaeia archaeon]
MAESQPAYDESQLMVIYEQKVRPLIDKKRYNEAFFFLSQNPEVKRFLSFSELKTMYNHAESHYLGLLNNVAREVYSSGLGKIVLKNKKWENMFLTESGEPILTRIKSLDLVSGEELN